ncbi:MAG: thiamine diphosphokinase [Chloroflexota bacterium]
MTRALIFVNGEFNHPGLTRSLVRPDDVVLAADGGARHALAIGVIPSVIIGDLDSLSDAEVRVFIQMNVEIQRFPPAKDETDLELALGYALKSGFGPILIVGAFGGRLDQTLGNIALLSDPEISQVDIRLDDGLTEAFFIRGSALIQGAPGDTVSLVPWGSPVEGVTTDGLAYPLKKETLYPYRTRSISNEMLGQTASLSIERGLLLCIHIRKTDY